MIGSSSYLVLREPYGKYDRCQAEEYHGHEAHPLGIQGGGPLEDGDDEEDEGGGDAEAAEEDTEKTDQPDPWEGGRETDPGSPLESDAALEQSQSGVSSNLGHDPVGHGETRHGEDVGGQEQGPGDDGQLVHYSRS